MAHWSSHLNPFKLDRKTLKFDRRHVVRSLTAWFLFGAIILVFIFWGMQPRSQGMLGGASAALVNNAMISQARVGEAVERMKQDNQYQQFEKMGDIGRQMLVQQALNQLIQTELLRQETEKNAILTSDSEVRDVIIKIPAFQEDGRFKKERYTNYLASVGKTAAELEAEIRHDQAIRRTVEVFKSALTPLAIEQELQDRAKELKANLDYVEIQTDSIVKPETVSLEDVNAFLKEQKNLVRAQDDYAAHKQEYVSEEAVKAKHILIKFENGKADSERQAFEKAKMIAERAKKEDFASLARQFSEDPGSKAKGGDLGFFSKGRMLPEFEKTAFALPVGKISEPIKTEYGYHLIKVEEKRGAVTREFEQVKNDIVKHLIAKERSAKALGEIEAAMKAGEQITIEKALTQSKLSWQETGVFSADGESIPKIGQNEEAIQVAFSLTPQAPIAKSLVRQGSKAFLLRYRAVSMNQSGGKKSAKVEGENPAENAELMRSFMANRRSEDSLRQWVEGLRKTAQIHVNLQMGQNTNEPSPFDQ